MQFEKKLERPPYVHNWVRNIGSDLESTIKRLVALALGFPVKTYGAANNILVDRIVRSLDRATAMKAALTTGRINSRDIVAEYVSAFYDYDEIRGYSGKPTYDEMVEPFRIGKGLFVPVKPLVNIVENGKLVPIFSVGWATFPLTQFQMRLLATVLEDAVFSLADFKMSPGEFICFPKEGKKPDFVRKPLVWKRGDVTLLSQGELRDCLDMYLKALDAANAILRDMPQKTEQPSKRKPSPNPNQLGWDL
jgi:hypothetical protein